MAYTGAQLILLAATLVPIGCDAAAQRLPQSGQGATRDPLPQCEWCGLADAPDDLSSAMSLASASEAGTRLEVTGTVYYADGRTPAADVLVYAYHTNAAGVYPELAAQTGNGRRHGALRGWLRTDAQGRYRISTIKPGPYPGRTDPRHIHLTEHLKGNDFFAVARYPLARFVLDSVADSASGAADRVQVHGALTIRDSTQTVTFAAAVSRCAATGATCIDAQLQIDRRHWGITYRYDPVRNLIVDDSIAFELHLEAPADTALAHS